LCQLTLKLPSLLPLLLNRLQEARNTSDWPAAWLLLLLQFLRPAASTHCMKQRPAERYTAAPAAQLQAKPPAVVCEEPVAPVHQSCSLMLACTAVQHLLGHATAPDRLGCFSTAVLALQGCLQLQLLLPLVPVLPPLPLLLPCWLSSACSCLVPAQPAASTCADVVPVLVLGRQLLEGCCLHNVNPVGDLQLHSGKNQPQQTA
jgi:hypothetical protein